jgi:hypothetical protein
MVYISGKKCSFTLLILSGSLSLAGCQTTPPPSKSTPSVKDVFTQDMQRVLIPQLLAANVQNLSGTLDLRIILNRASEPVACEARKSRHPSAIGFPRPQALSELAVRQCWNMIYPKVPEAFFGADGTAEIHAPLVFSATEYPNDVGHQQRLQYAARSQYFWDRVFASQPPNSIGVAGFRYQADADGKVKGCLVSLEPSRMRPDAFKFDTQLQQRLTGRCNALDLKQMPGFATDEAGVARGLVGVEYAPWKGRAH